MGFEQVTEGYVCNEFSKSFRGGMPDNLRGYDWYIMQDFFDAIHEAMEAFDQHDAYFGKWLEDDYMVVALGVKSNEIYTQPKLL